MTLREIYHGLIDIGQESDRLAHILLSRQHRLGVSLRDMATGIENACRSLTPATLEVIKVS
jgi:hypothetical protein